MRVWILLLIACQTEPRPPLPWSPWHPVETAVETAPRVQMPPCGPKGHAPPCLMSSDAGVIEYTLDGF